MKPAAALPLALAAALLVAGPAQAQKVFRCVDQNGKTYYTEQPGPSCKTVRIDVPATPPPAAKKAAPVPSKAVAKRSAPAALTREAHCSGLTKEALSMDQGKSGGLQGPAADTRRAGIQRELDRSCRG